MNHLPIWFIGQAPDKECDTAFLQYKSISPKNATMGTNGDILDTQNRNTTVRFADDKNIFGFNLHNFGLKANSECKWNFHLTSFESVQFAEYGIGQHYNWHIDTFFLSGKPYDRKVTVICLMNDLSEFVGGELKLRFGGKEYLAPLKKGTIIAFPSFIEHCVTPVTSGTRYSSTMWINGPEFR